ncbi:siphovirus ReqiPepy6 Gp37-like family protein [Rossellomorea sp. BNER]|uniref:siphovirus ReqiPepy6 Gp37-like family protein n=1 Tax=Rossellomorea sp. BNER TaxID=2962031 RepID=UPI003AF210AA|nr:siphovirus ReqiPepy6 Gp37-like family protein [Rossellomorea sp. BNER]
MNYKLYVRDQYFRKVVPITDYKSLKMLLKFNASSTWEIILPTDCEATKELYNTKAGIIVKRNNVTILSGTVNKSSRSFSRDEDTITFSGFDDTHLLENIASPVPNGASFSTQEYDVRTGVAETIMKQYADVNIGQNAQSVRKIHNLINSVDKGLGKTVTGRARFHKLMELFQSLALSGGDLGFKIAQSGDNLEFQVYQPTDKTKIAVFSPLLGNLLDFEYNIEKPKANYIIVGGGGEGTERLFVEGGDNESIAKYSRMELFVDQRNTTDIAELKQTLEEELANNIEQTSLSITPNDTENLAFGRDYNLGDKVSVIITQPNEVIDVETLYYFISAYQSAPFEVERVRKIQEKISVVEDVVREVNLTITPTGESISPVVGTPDSLSSVVPKIYKNVDKLTKRINKLERR